MSALRSGYPRFFENPLVTKLIRHVCADGRGGSEVILCANRLAAEQVLALAGGGRVRDFCEGAIHGVVFSADEASLYARGRVYIKRTGTGLSSRVAEAELLRLGILSSPYEEERLSWGAEDVVLEELQRATSLDREWIELASSGMNAFFAAFEAVNALSKAKGRRRWVRLGWLYVDTMEIIDEMGDPDFPPVVWGNLSDLDGLRERLAPIAHEIAGIIVEVPTNPFFEEVDQAELGRLAKGIGAFLLVDPSLVSLWNVGDWAQADVLVSSLTKYAANDGDVLAGVVVVNPEGKQARALVSEIRRQKTPLSSLDLARMAAQIGGVSGFVSRVNQTLPVVVDFLRTHPKVKKVWHPEGGPSAYRNGPGGVCSFLVRGDMRLFYDSLEMAKGPSFGTHFTLLSPYMWLAHYGMMCRGITTKSSGRAAGDGDLLRLSIGQEEADTIIRALKQAFAGV